MPWEMIVDSSATTGFPAARAASTSGEHSKNSLESNVRILLYCFDPEWDERNMSSATAPTMMNPSATFCQ